MARRSPGRLPALLISVAVLAACSGSGGEAVTPDSVVTSLRITTTTVRPTSSTVGDTTTTSSATTSTTGPAETGVGIPEGDGTFPAVVLVHGGGWVVGSPASMTPLADYLNLQGYLTVNTAYQLSINSPGFPGAVEDVSCAVARAANHPRSNGEVTVIGHSAGAHIGAIVALAADSYDDGCEPPDSGSPARFVGLAGPYDTERVGGIVAAFFGADQEADPELWASGNPMNLVDGDTDLEVLLLHGDADGVVPVDFSESFATSLEAGGVIVELSILPGVDHSRVTSPQVVGDLIVEWIEG
ncbi:MAG: alpha/beta hydrolase [Acidimicrobiia bacterium]